MNFKKILAIIMLATIIFIALGIPLATSVSYEQPTIETSALVIAEIVEEEPAAAFDEEIIESEPEEDINLLPATTIYTTTKLRLRVGPSTDTEIVNTLKINTELEKIGEEGNWTIVRIDGNKYYVYSKYTSTEKTIIKTTSRASSSNRVVEMSVNNTSEQGSRQFYRILYTYLLLLLF